jgi:hypothetical protein
MLSPSAVITAIIEAGGSYALAAERLKTTTTALLAIIANSPDTLPEFQRRMHALVQLQMFDILMQVAIGMPATLEDMKSADIAKLYTDLLNAASPRSDSLSITEIVTQTRTIAAQQGMDPDVAEEHLRNALQSRSNGHAALN